ncbi:PAS domain S-box-containing protein/diguanylate cyclase (GGDEF) domain-containing protein [Caenispirillum bisanense]|uniref:PAS domain S-box-containing protein/diguanylate cyclase (GGDEF) domain-containing protein n=1 Tax=Caenispirillum bisanense TaxID=414052 RepID=A0A286GPC0_9PROT|nr:PAS domain S-box-containing protein/diguanylate cyclase (GGDEF) domain-containing protein [Caenispirillum bisanense]
MKLLLIEDNATDARLFEELANESGEAIAIEWARSLAEAEQFCDACCPDVVVTDLGLPDSRGLDTVDRVLRLAGDRPVVVMTGLGDPQTGVQAVQQGCQDYVVKGITDPALLARTLRHAVERHAAERQVRESEERFRALVEMSPDAILLVADTGVVFANPSALRLFGRSRRQHLEGMALATLFAGPGGGALAAVAAGVLAGASPQQQGQEYRLADLDGRLLEVEASLAAVRFGGRNAAQVVLRDIAARRAREREQRLTQAVFQTTAEAMCITDARQRIVAVNRAFSETTGYGAEDILGQTPAVLSSGRHDDGFYSRMWQSLEATGHWRGEVWNRRADGVLYVQRLTISQISDDDGTVTNYVGVFSDITAEKEATAQLQHSATHDALTGLPNRALMQDRLTQALARSTRDGGGLAVLFIDLDGFKPVNDTWGHLAGDMLLQGVARRLRKCVRESDTVARIGGDEFVIVSIGSADAEAASTVADKVLRALAPPFQLGVGEAAIGASIGIAIAPGTDRPVAAPALLDAADHAMYEAKHAGKGVWRLAGQEELAATG